MFSYITTVSQDYALEVWSYIDSKELYVNVLNTIGGNKVSETLGEYNKKDIAILIDLVNPSDKERFKAHVKHLCKTHKKLLRNRG